MMELSAPDQIVYQALVQAADNDAPCPTCDDLLQMLNDAGHEYSAVASTVNIIDRIARAGLITVHRWQRTRKVCIVETGKCTKQPINTTPHWRQTPRDCPAPSKDQVEARAPQLSKQIFQRATERGVSVAEYLTHLVWVGWNVEKGNG